MTKSSEIQENIVNFLTDMKEHTVQEIKTYLQENGINDYSEGQFAGSINTLLRNNTISKTERGVYIINSMKENTKTCFIVSPIGAEGSEIRKRADQVFKYIIAPVCTSTGFNPIRVDQLNQPDSITQTIIDYLKNSELVIADITGHNPNAFYEMGYRAATNKIIINIKDKNENIPFDIAGIRAFDYDLSDLDSVEEIKSRLIKTISTIPFENFSEQSETCDSNSDSSQLVPILYEIKDEISLLRSQIREKDTETIQAVVKATSAVVPVEDSNTAIMKALLPELVKNPESFKKLLEMSEAMKKKNN